MDKMERPTVSNWFFLWIIVALGSCVLCVEQITNPRIIEHPKDKYVAKKQPETLNCMATGDPPPEITWYRNGELVETSSMNPSSNHILLPSGQLFFLRIIHNKNNKPDVGTYYCKATNPETQVSVVSRNATLKLAVLRDDFRVNPRNTEVAVGDSAVLECRSPKGLPEPDIRWMKGGEFIETDGRLRIQEPGNLLIQDARKHDSGTYVCVAQNKAGEKESIPARLYVREKPTFVRLPEKLAVEENESVQFQCQAIGDPTPTIVWKKEEGQIPQGRSRILSDRSLKIEKVKISDEGIYICRAENSVGFLETFAKLTVRSQPSFIVTPTDKIVGVGRRVSFRCEVTGNPSPSVFWTKGSEDDLMFPDQELDRFSVSKSGTLVIEPVHMEDAGEYTCSAISAAGNAYSKARLQVRDVDPRPPPIIHQGPQNQTLPVDSVAMMVCSCSGSPKPVIRWYKNNRLLRMFDARITVLDSGTLQISGLRLVDTAMYTCKASSETGETSWSAALIVESPTNPAVIFHRTPEPSTFPGPPSKPDISDLTETSMTLSWKANTNHGASPVFAYTVEYFSHETGEGWIVATDSVTNQRYTVKNLRPDTVYMFLVRAHNSHGLSLPSQVSGPLRTTGGTGVRPTVTPYDLQLVAEKLSGNVVQMKQSEVISSTAVKINWEVKKAQRFIEGFHIKYRILPGSDHHRADQSYSGRIEYTIETVTGNAATMYVLRNLHRFTWYEIQVQPFYSSVEGPGSKVDRVRTFEDVPTAPPQKIAAKFEENGTLHLSWQPPPVSEINGPIRGYKIFIFGNESKFNREITTNASTFRVTALHLVPGMVYRIQVLAWNRMGDGMKSSPLVLGDKDGGGLMHGIVGQPWFIATLIGIIGGTLWIALCVFSIWLYRKRRASKKVKKNGSLGAHKTDQQSRLEQITNQTAQLSDTCHSGSAGVHGNQAASSSSQPLEALRPDVANVMGQGADAPSKENLYNTPEIPSIPMKTFYNRGNHGVAPYATTTLITNPHEAHGSGNAFRPINADHPQNSGSGESGRGQGEMNWGNDSSTDNSRSNMEAGYLPQEGALESEYEGVNAGEQEPMLQRRYGSPNHPVLFLPPPPEHPPPSDIGTPPDSPRASFISPSSGYDSNRGFRPYPRRGAHEGACYAPRSDYSDNDRHQGSRPHEGRPHHPRHGSEHRLGNTDTMGSHNRGSSPKSKDALSPNMSHYALQNDPRSYSPRAVSEPERGPTPPVRAYKLVPIRDNDIHRAYSDTDGAPVPPLRMLSGGHSPPSPAPLDPMMDRGVQSSLPSLANECTNRSDNPMCDPSMYRPDSLVEDMEPNYDEYMERARNPDCPSPGSSNGDSNAAGSMIAAWASVTDNSDTNNSSVRSSGASSSDASFLAEADFASAVAKAAELSGLTVIGSTVHDPNAGREREREREREKVKKTYRQRSERSKRPTSPYSTDSNYSSVVVPHKPYPKSERKRQLQDPARQNRRNSGHNYDYSGSPDVRRSRPPIKTKPQIPQHVADLPSYSRPNFPTASGNTSGTNGGGSTLGYSRGGNPKGSKAGSPHSPGQNDGPEGANIRTNPLAAFDTRDTPIV